MNIVKTIPDNSIDLVVTDPPYKCISGGKPHKKGQPSGMLSKNDGEIFDHNDIAPEEWMPEIYRILKDRTHCYIMTNVLNMEKYLSVAKEAGFQVHNILVWKKNNVTPNRWYMKNGEFTLFLRKGKAKVINNIGSKMVHDIPNIIGKKSHPTEKPVELMKLYIENSSICGDVVLDPFMGSGSTGEAAIMANRKFLGCEIDDYFWEAKKRIENCINERGGVLQ